MKRTLTALTVAASLLSNSAWADNGDLQKLKDTNECIGCWLSGTWGNLSGAKLVGANLSEANLLFLNMSGANLSGANLSEAMLIDVNLSGANLSGANLFGMRLCFTTMPARSKNSSGC